jgi:1-aminocyclopropane-1-carboxylate deaminase/D-cysteine desulfhydrase-like pyridoxal-dependent ACC family enzyme
MEALFARFPRLADSLPYVELGVRETPVEPWVIGDATMLAKRDDLSAPPPGGNKVRALELLLAGVRGDQTLLTVGATGSTHALAVAEHGARLGSRTTVITWPQETHPVARATAARLEGVADVVHAGSVAEAYLRAAMRRLRGGVHWVPAGGSVPRGALGHVSAALDTAEQLLRAGWRPPDTLVVPLGTGGTAAGLLVGLALAGLATQVVGVRVVPRVVANRARVLRLARRTHALLARLAGVELPALDATRFLVDGGAYGGAYGRETADARAAAEELRMAGGPMLEATYSAKAFSVALARARHSPDERVLFWLTFDGRWLATGAVPTWTPRPSPPSR